MESQRPFVSDRQNMLDALRRLYDTDEAMYFRNRDETLDFFLRVDPSEEDAMGFELCAAFLSEPATPQYRKMIERSTTVNDDEALLYKDFSIDFDATAGSPEVEKAMDILNAHHDMSICPCARYVIKDGYDMCFACHLTASADELRKTMCTICHRETPRVTMTAQACCKQLIHQSCLARWHQSEASGTNPACPMCRAVSKIFSM